MVWFSAVGALEEEAPMYISPMSKVACGAFVSPGIQSKFRGGNHRVKDQDEKEGKNLLGIPHPSSR